jgi:hypothetical protein
MSMLRLVLLLAAVACTTPVAEVTPASAASELITLGNGEAQLRQAFNAQSDGPQLLVILSPT